MSIAGSDALDATVQESIAQAHRVLRDLRRLFDTASRLLEGNATLHFALLDGGAAEGQLTPAAKESIEALETLTGTAALEAVGR